MTDLERAVTRTLPVLTRHVEAHGWAPSLAELAAAVGVSAPTVRADLVALAAAGFIDRSPNGARRVRIAHAVEV